MGGAGGVARGGMDLFSGQVAKSHKTTDWNELVPRR